LFIYLVHYYGLYWPPLFVLSLVVQSGSKVWITWRRVKCGLRIGQWVKMSVSMPTKPNPNHI